MTNRHIDPTRALEFISSEVHEVHVDLNAEALRHIAKDAQALIIRVQTFGPSGRPTFKSLRIPTDALKEPPMPSTWDD